MILFITKIYSAIYVFLANNFRINIRGFGFLLRSISKDYILNVHGNKIYLDNRISTSYARLIIGQWNEPETHVFVENFAKKFTEVSFFDIGANIGEMVIDFSNIENITTIVAFEPDALCAHNVNINAILNNKDNIIIENIALSNENKQSYLVNGGTPQASISDVSVTEGDELIDVKKFDTYIEKSCIDFSDDENQMLILIDVEGAELSVLQGAIKTIKKHMPVIIFEYNTISKQHFNLDQISNLLGDDYKIRRLNRAGKIDDNLDDTWNCIAIPLKLIDIV